MIVCSFPPIADPEAEVLILGSMPGKVSLARQQYYAHPQNLFWRLMGELFNAGPELAYEERLRKLRQHKVALWDVLKECYRESAMDADIVEESIVVNDFAEFFKSHARIARICFNGSKAEQAFRKYALPGLTLGGVELVRLPSTSPANASVPLAQKLAAWRAVLS